MVSLLFLYTIADKTQSKILNRDGRSIHAMHRPNARPPACPMPYLLLKRSNPSPLNYNLLIDPMLRITILHTLVGCYPRFVHIDVEEPYSSVVASVSAVSPEARTTCVAHPEGWIVIFGFR